MRNDRATNHESSWRMRTDMHSHRLPRKGRDALICLKFYYEWGAFIVKSLIRSDENASRFGPVRAQIRSGKRFGFEFVEMPER